MKNNPYIQLFKKYWQFVPNKKKTILLLGGLMTGHVLSLLNIYFFGKILIVVQQGGPEVLERAMMWGAIAILVKLIERAIWSQSRIAEQRNDFWSTKRYKEYLYAAVTTMPLSWHTDHHSGESIDKIDKATEALSQFSGSLFQFLQSAVMFVGSFIALFVIRPYVAVGLLVVGISTILIIKHFDVKNIARIKERNEVEHKTSSLLYDYISNIKSLITLRYIEPTKVVLGNNIEKGYAPENNRMKREELKWFIVDMILQTIIVVMLLGYVWHSLHTAGVVLFGVIAMLVQYLQKASSAFYDFAWQYSRVVRMHAKISAANTIESDYRQILALQKVSVHTLPASRHTINISHLQFSYKEQAAGTHTLRDAALRLSRGEKIALVGESGSGKSTFLSLLRGLYDVDSVRVDIDGTVYDTMHVFADNTSLIPQEPEIFEETMRFNITMGSESSDDLVHKYSQMACFHDIALRLPHGYDTSIKEKGVNLSGGQKQRLALARGLMASEESDILLLDESTSSVDSINEKKIYQNIWTAYPEKTIVAVIHKLHLLPMFDMIYVFDEGKASESGSFDALRTQGGIFTRMWDQYSVDMEVDADESENELNDAIV